MCKGRVHKAMVSDTNQLMGSSDMRSPQVRVLWKASLGAWVLASPPDTPTTFHLCGLWLESLGRGTSEVPSERFLYKVDKGMQVQVMEASTMKE